MRLINLNYAELINEIGIGDDTSWVILKNEINSRYVPEKLKYSYKYRIDKPSTEESTVQLIRILNNQRLITE